MTYEKNRTNAGIKIKYLYVIVLSTYSHHNMSFDKDKKYMTHHQPSLGPVIASMGCADFQQEISSDTSP